MCRFLGPAKGYFSRKLRFVTRHLPLMLEYMSLHDLAVREKIIDFVIWLLFSKSDRSASWPKHLLCDGFRRMPMADDNADTSIPGVFSWFPNSHVDTLKQAPWTHALALLGKSGERIMIDLLLDCSIFVAIQAGSGNYYQLSGE